MIKLCYIGYMYLFFLICDPKHILRLPTIDVLSIHIENIILEFSSFTAETKIAL